MPHGVERSPEEIEALKTKIVETMMSTAGATFYGSCQVCGVGSSEAYEWRTEDKAFDDAVLLAFRVTDAMGTDLAQSKLIRQIHNDVLKAITYWLDRKGGERGFNPKIINENMDVTPPAFVQDFGGVKADVPTPEA